MRRGQDLVTQALPEVPEEDPDKAKAAKTAKTAKPKMGKLTGKAILQEPCR